MRKITKLRPSKYLGYNDRPLCNKISRRICDILLKFPKIFFPKFNKKFVENFKKCDHLAKKGICGANEVTKKRPLKRW